MSVVDIKQKSRNSWIFFDGFSAQKGISRTGCWSVFSVSSNLQGSEKSLGIFKTSCFTLQMASTQGNLGDSIACRTSKLNQMFQGRKLSADQKSVVGREGLLDALFVLYDECSNECLMKNEYIANFVKKCKYHTELQWRTLTHSFYNGHICVKRFGRFPRSLRTPRCPDGLISSVFTLTSFSGKSGFMSAVSDEHIKSPYPSATNCKKEEKYT